MTNEHTGLARFVEYFPDPLIAVDINGVVVVANREARRRVLFERELHAHTRITDLVLDTEERVLAYIKLWSRSAQPLPGSLTFGRNHGEPSDVRVLGWAVDGADERIILLRLAPRSPATSRFVALNARIEQLTREIARRIRAEQTAHEQREMLSVTLSSIGDAVITTDTNGRITFMNPVAEALTGWTFAEAKQSRLDDIFKIQNEETGTPVESPVEKVLRSGLVVGLANHTVLVRRDSTSLPIDDSGAPIRDQKGQLMGVVLVFHEVAERRRMERELRLKAAALEATDRRKDEFLAMLAHELRNPLAPLRNCIEILRTHSRSSVDSEQLAAMMARQTAQLTRLVDDLLDVSRITRGKIQLKTQATDLGTILEHAIETIGPFIRQQRHELNVHLSPERLFVEADLARMSQVFCNLLSNAAKFMGPGGRIDVITEKRGNRAVVKVKDTGPGLPDHLLPFIFDLFVQGTQGLDRQQGGLGIGLTLVRTLVEMHHGKVEAASEGLGRGSEFTVYLPLISERPRAQRQTKGAAAAIHRTVLIVDDNVDAAESLRMVLAGWGCIVVVAHDGPSALRIAALDRPDVVLLDLGLPGMDGLEVARRLRRIPGFLGLIIALTGYGREVLGEDIQSASFNAHLVKPVALDKLSAVIAAADIRN